MKTYDTLVEAMNGLKAQGFTLDFNLAFDQIKCENNGICLRPEEFEIVQTHRFEGMTNPSDSSILYAIAAKDGTMKGLLVSAYGTYATEMDTSMLRKLALHR